MDCRGIDLSVPGEPNGLEIGLGTVEGSVWNRRGLLAGRRMLLITMVLNNLDPTPRNSICGSKR